MLYVNVEIMGTKLYKHAYEELIKEDIEILYRFIPDEYGLERGHIRQILQDSVDHLYPPQKKRRFRLFRRFKPLFN